MITFTCPTKEQILGAALKLLPRGRAWQTHEGGPIAGYDPTFEPFAFASDTFATDHPRKSILWQYWASAADVWTFFVQRLCALRMEFWCATQSETRDWWMTEYGLPDACDPFPDLCAKVAAIGGTRCEYYAAIAARAGWKLQCVDTTDKCGARMGNAKTGKSRVGTGETVGLLRVVVDLNQSPSYVAGTRSRTRKTGMAKAGQRLTCASPGIVMPSCTSAMSCMTRWR